MEFNNEITAKGEWEFTVEDREGNKKVSKYENVVTLGYRSNLINAMAGLEGATDKIQITHEQLGENSTTANENQTDLLSPDASTLQIITSTGTSNNVIETTSFWDEGTATGEWREFGLLNITDGVRLLINRVVISVDVLSTNRLTVRGRISYNI